MSFHQVVLALVMTVVSSACVPRVTLKEPPPPTAPVEQREAALQALSPVGTAAQVTKHGANTQFMLLGDGTRVVHPIDLLPAVLPDSQTADFARRTDEGLKRSTVALGIAGGLLAVGFGINLAFIGTLAGQPPARVGSSAPDFTLLGVGTGIMASSLIPLIVALVMGSSVGMDRESAFLTYARDLRARLGFDPLGPTQPCVAPPASL